MDEREAAGSTATTLETFRRRRAVGGWPKRLFDIVVAVTACILLLPLAAMIAVLVATSSNGPIIFRHRRIGFAGASFQCLKFRTMRSDSAEMLQRHLLNDARARDEWSATQKLCNDPRITTFGYILRRTSLDELPQVINILRGEMSLVGPRPIVPEEMSRYGAHFEAYCSAKPGLTGLWQVGGRNDVSYQARVALDRAYVEHYSFWLDLKIMLKTVPALLRMEGSY